MIQGPEPVQEASEKQEDSEPQEPE